MLRVRTVLLVRDVFLHINLLKEPGLYTSIQGPSLLVVLTDGLDLSQKEWLSEAVNLMSGLKRILEVLDEALNHTGRMSPQDPHDRRQTYLLMSSCKLFCMTAQARIHMETSNLPIVPKNQTGRFRDLARDSVQHYLLIYKTFDQEDDLLHLDYFLVVSRSSLFPPLRSSVSLTITPQACWQHVRELYLALYPGDLDWFPFTEVSRQLIVLEGTLRGSPAGRGMSVVHSMVNLESGERSPDEPNLLREEDRLIHGL